MSGRGDDAKGGASIGAQSARCAMVAPASRPRRLLLMSRHLYAQRLTVLGCLVLPRRVRVRKCCQRQLLGVVSIRCQHECARNNYMLLAGSCTSRICWTALFAMGRAGCGCVACRLQLCVGCCPISMCIIDSIAGWAPSTHCRVLATSWASAGMPRDRACCLAWHNDRLQRTANLSVPGVGFLAGR